MDHEGPLRGLYSAWRPSDSRRRAAPPPQAQNRVATSKTPSFSNPSAPDLAAGADRAWKTEQLDGFTVWDNEINHHIADPGCTGPSSHRVECVSDPSPTKSIIGDYESDSEHPTCTS